MEPTAEEKDKNITKLKQDAQLSFLGTGPEWNNFNLRVDQGKRKTNWHIKKKENVNEVEKFHSLIL